MQAPADTRNLNPPQAGRWRGPLLIAFVVHLLLMLALTWGVGWQRDSAPVVLEAELWSRLPEVAAPRASEPEPPQPPAPEPRPEPTPPPEPAPGAEPAGPSEAEIALQKKREKEREDKLRQEAERKQQAEREAAAKREEERKRREAQAAKEKAEKTAREKEAARQQAQLEAERKKNLERMLGQAGATGAPGSTGTAQRSSGPSASYAGQVVGRIRPNIVFPDVIAGNPRAEVEVRTLPDGTILGRRLTQPSGNAAWDDAVLRAIDRTARLPKDENGRVPPTLILGFRPQD